MRRRRRPPMDRLKTGLGQSESLSLNGGGGVESDGRFAAAAHARTAAAAMRKGISRVPTANGRPKARALQVAVRAALLAPTEEGNLQSCTDVVTEVGQSATPSASIPPAARPSIDECVAD